MAYSNRIQQHGQDEDYDEFELDEDDLTTGDKVSAVLSEKGKPWLQKALIKLILFFLAILFGICVFSFVSFCWVDVGRQTNALAGMQSVDGLFYTKGAIDNDTLLDMQAFIQNLPDDTQAAIKQA